MTDNSLFQTKRSELLALYAKNGVPFLATTRGLHSTRSLVFTVTDFDPSSQFGFLVAARGQQLVFFNYGINESIELGADPAHRATEADTSLTKGSRTTASADLSIEWITMHPRALKVKYASAAPFMAVPSATVAAALAGTVALVDPLANVIPADVGSSATLHHVLYNAVAPHLTCRFEWDNADRTEKLGTVDQFVEGGGASYLLANGEPSVNNRFRIPEGFLWAREGQPASELQVICRLEEEVVIPFKGVSQMTGEVLPAMLNAYVEIMMRLGGMLLRVPGSN
jgi:hypothetical protein